MENTTDVNGKQSSKRLHGKILLSIAIAMGVVHFIIGLIMTYKGLDYKDNFPLEMWWTFMGTGAGLLGITVFERPKN
tara:strand:+ start:918 stop:1148 length:231 start_codon:yes stop_codon:yes gene_type:complete